MNKVLERLHGIRGKFPGEHGFLKDEKYRTDMWEPSTADLKAKVRYAQVRYIKALEDQGMPQREAAQRAGISVDTYRRWRDAHR